MKIAIIHPFLFRYARGIERYVLALGRAFSDAGASVTLLTWRWPQPLALDTPDERVRVRQLADSRYGRALLAAPFYAWHLARARFDHVLLFWADYGEAQAVACADRARRQRITAVLHYPYAAAPHRYESFRRSGLARRADHVVAVSGYVAASTRTAWGRASTVIGHGVDTCRFRPNPAVRVAVRQHLGLAPDVPLLVTTAALEPRKGVARVLGALPELPDVQYVIAGDGPERKRLVALAADLGVNERVHLLGALPNVAPLLQAADAFVLLATGEASSLSTLEALACGLPVLVSDEPPFDELVPPAQRIARDALALLPARLAAALSQGQGEAAALPSWSEVAGQYLAMWGV